MNSIQELFLKTHSYSADCLLWMSVGSVVVCGAVRVLEGWQRRRERVGDWLMWVLGVLAALPCLWLAVMLWLAWLKGEKAGESPSSKPVETPESGE